MLMFLSFDSLLQSNLSVSIWALSTKYLITLPTFDDYDDLDITADGGVQLNNILMMQ